MRVVITTTVALLVGGCASRPAAQVDRLPIAQPGPQSSGVVFGRGAGGRVAPAAVLVRNGGAVLSGDEAGKSRPPPAGKTISIDVVDADLHHVLRLIGDVSGLNFVADDGVSGRLTVRMLDVPWNYALEAILASRGLTARPLAGGGVHVTAIASTGSAR